MRTYNFSQIAYPYAFAGTFSSTRIGHTTGWQYMLPSDEGAVRHPHSYYCEPLPNKIMFPHQQSSTCINTLSPNPLPCFEHLYISPG